MNNLATEKQLVPETVTQRNKTRWSAPNLDTSPVDLRADRPKNSLHLQAHSSPLTPDSPYTYADGELLCIENQAPLPVGHCIVTNELADETVRIPLRDAKNPNTWWGRRPALKVGLSNEVLAKVRTRNALTWVTLGVGIEMMIFGVGGTFIGSTITLTLASYGIGMILCAISGYFRASGTISAPKVGRAFTVIQGVHPEFLKKFDQYGPSASLRW